MKCSSRRNCDSRLSCSGCARRSLNEVQFPKELRLGTELKRLSAWLPQ